MRIVKRSLMAVITTVAITCSANSQGADSLTDVREAHGLNIDQNQISVSGISSGGWMANQFHIAYSEKIMGIGILAAGPYRCARNRSFMCDFTPFGFFMPHDSCQALYVCSKFASKAFGLFGFFMGPPDANSSVEATLKEAGGASIDPISGLSGDRVWLFSGRSDSLAPQEVMDELHSYYSILLEKAGDHRRKDQMTYITDKKVEHAMVIAAPGPNRCEVFGLPFINDCDYDAAGSLLSFIYEEHADLEHETIDSGKALSSSLLQFDQSSFFDATDPSVSMHSRGHLFVPQACQNGAGCRLHVAFHGCEQFQDVVEWKCASQAMCPALFFFKDAGYNEWAERNNTVVLYPQTVAWGSEAETGKNPKGCWDWWGYSGEDYFRKSGKQIAAVNWMIDCLTGAAPCP